MKRVMCIIMICFLVIAGSLYTIGYSRVSSKMLLQNQIANRSENIHSMLLRERDGPLPRETLSSEWEKNSEHRIAQGADLIQSWLSHIVEKVNEYGK